MSEFENNDDEDMMPDGGATGFLKSLLEDNEQYHEQVSRMQLRQDKLLQSARVRLNDLTDRVDGINERESMALTAGCRKISNAIAKKFHGVDDERVRDFLAEFMLDCVALYRVKPVCECGKCRAEKKEVL